MPFETGALTSYNDANSVADPIIQKSAGAIQHPLHTGRLWNDLGDFNEDQTSMKFDTYSRSMTARSGVTGDWASTSATTALPMVSTSGLVKGLQLKVGTEVVVIDAVTASTIDVKSRGAGGTTAVAHDGATFDVIGVAINDEDLKDMSGIREITNKYSNHMQIVAEVLDFTKGGIYDIRKGLTSNQEALCQEEAMLRLAKSIYATTIHGVKQEGNGGTLPSMTAGFIQQLTDTTGGRIVLEESTVGALTEAKFREALRKVSVQGMPTDVYLSTANKEIINGWNTAIRRTTTDDTQAGFRIDTYDYEGNVLRIKVDADIPNDVIMILNINKCKKGWKSNDALAYYSDGEERKVSSREKRASYNGAFGLDIEDVGYEHIIMTGVTQA